MPTITLTGDAFIPEAVDLEDEDLQGTIQRQATGLQASLDKLREEVREIENDPGLTREGKREARKKAARQLQPGVQAAAMTETIEGLREEIETERKRLLNPDHRLEIEDVERDRALAEEREIRAELRALKGRDEHGDIEVEKVLRDAAENDDRLLLRAVEKDPLSRVDPILGEDALAEVREKHIETRWPDRAQDIENRERAVDMMEHNAERADEVAREVAGEPLVQTDEAGIREL